MPRAIWSYPSFTNSIPLLRQVFLSQICPCCIKQPLLAPAVKESQSDGHRYSEYLQVLVCSECGWWFISKDSWDSSCGSVPDNALRHIVVTGASLANYTLGSLDHARLNLLCTEVEQHLLSRGVSSAWDVMEDVTLAILRDFGYQAHATTRSKDGGVDIVMEHLTQGTVYVQIKHSRNKVGVHVLRELIGTMCIHNVNDALLVTSSGFTKGVHRERDAASASGKIVELVDGERFIAALNLASRLVPPTLDDILTVAKPCTTIVWEEREI